MNKWVNLDLSLRDNLLELATTERSKNIDIYRAFAIYRYNTYTLDFNKI